MVLKLIQLSTGNTSKKLGVFKSYDAIAQWLVKHGETGAYFVLPNDPKNLLSIKKVNVVRHGRNRGDTEVEIEGWGRY